MPLREAEKRGVEASARCSNPDLLTARFAGCSVGLAQSHPMNSDKEKREKLENLLLALAEMIDLDMGRPLRAAPPVAASCSIVAR